MRTLLKAISFFIYKRRLCIKAESFPLQGEFAKCAVPYPHVLLKLRPKTGNKGPKHCNLSNINAIESCNKL